MMPAMNPCMHCGACCAFYKVSFSLSEIDIHEGGTVPVDYAVQISSTQYAMRGTEKKNKRCMALKGRVGHQVSCAIYDQRPTCCHNFIAAWEKGTVNPICNRARVIYGLPPFDAF